MSTDTLSAYILKPSNLFVCPSGKIIRLPQGEIQTLLLVDGQMSWQTNGSAASNIPMSPKEFKAFSDAVLENQQGGVAL